MANYKWPNVYPSIKDLSGVVATNSVTACAYVGEAEFGPINKPTLLSTLKNYTTTFGALNSAKYGYAGYSLAVASESIDTHYFVRVVHAGDPANHAEGDAKYAGVKIAKQGGTTTAGAGWYVETVDTAVNKNDSGVFFTDDSSNAIAFVANNPNNLKFGVRLTDSTINENRAFALGGITFGEPDANHMCVATATGVNTQYVSNDLVVGDAIEITRTETAGVYTVTEISENKTTVKYKVKAIEGENSTWTKPADVPAGNGKISKYPKPSERTFRVEVLKTIGRIEEVVETYEYCTLYQAKDNYGNSMFLEDVINDSSDYILAFVNPNLLNALDEDEVLEPELTKADLVGGTSGIKPTSAELNAGWELFRDRTQTSVSLLMNSGYTNNAETSYQAKMLEIAEYRRDCFCLFDIPVSETEYEDAIDWRKNTLAMNSYRGALSAPWVKTYDSVQGRANFLMCPSAYVAKLIGAAGDPWNAPAGPNRGVISSATVSPTGLTQAYNPVEGGTMYADNQINCIIKDAGAGYVNWGQRTLQQKPSSLDRINVARTIIYIETVLRDAARWHLFENNTPYERMQIALQFSSFLDTILSANGIASYKVICDNTNNTPIVIANNQLVIDIIITPVYAAESIILNTTVTGADASVTVTSSAS
jgi:phage tail sheath protein FI